MAETELQKAKRLLDKARRERRHYRNYWKDARAQAKAEMLLRKYLSDAIDRFGILLTDQGHVWTDDQKHLFAEMTGDGIEDNHNG